MNMKRFFISVYFWLMVLFITVLGLAVLPFFLLVYAGFLHKSIHAAIRWGISLYGWTLVTVVPFLNPVKVESRAGKPPRPVIFVPNHASAIDPYLFGALLTDACFVTSWPFKIPVYNMFMRLAGYVNADEGWEKVFVKCTEMLTSGVSIIIWPEGHRSRDGRLGKFKNGAFVLAARTGFPLLPVCILGSGRFLPPGKRLMTPTRVRMILLEPIYPNPRNDQQQEVIRLRNAVRGVIEETLGKESDCAGGLGLERG